MKLAKTYKELIDNMTSCYQFESMNMLEHGQAVHDAFNKLIDQLEGGETLIELPPQIQEIYNQTKKSIGFLAKYQVFHDCGKPLCRIVDDNGKQHFPDHAKYSYLQFLEIFPEDTRTAELIRMDMDFHTLKGDEIDELWKHELAPALYFTAWAEIIANGKMFGGFESTSFKIKKKCLIKAGNRFCGLLTRSLQG